MFPIIEAKVQEPKVQEPKDETDETTVDRTVDATVDANGMEVEEHENNLRDTDDEAEEADDDG